LAQLCYPGPLLSSALLSQAPARNCLSSHCPLSSWPSSAWLCPRIPGHISANQCPRVADPIRPQPFQCLCFACHTSAGRSRAVSNHRLSALTKASSIRPFASLSGACIALCSTEHCRLPCQTHQIVTHRGFALAVPCESMPCPLLNQSVPSLSVTLPSFPSQCLHFTLQFFTPPRPCGSVHSPCPG